MSLFQCENGQEDVTIRRKCFELHGSAVARARTKTSMMSALNATGNSGETTQSSITEMLEFHMPNPCVPTDGVPMNSIEGEPLHVPGSGDFVECIQLVRKYLLPVALET